MDTRLLQALYALLAVLGAVMTWSNNLAWMAETPQPTLSAFWVEAFATPVSSSLAWDILIAGMAGFVLVATEVRRLGMHWGWLVFYLVAGNGIAAAFALPFFLLFRERALAAGR